MLLVQLMGTQQSFCYVSPSTVNIGIRFVNKQTQTKQKHVNDLLRCKALTQIQLQNSYVLFNSIPFAINMHLVRNFVDRWRGGHNTAGGAATALAAS